jgi:SAM-dependent methyltransferase
MHTEARDFTVFVKEQFPEFFVGGKKVLDVGSGDINGNNRFLFTDCEYHGNDVAPAPNVTIVSKTAALPFEDETFDCIISTECFEHDPEWKESFRKILKMLKPGGLFFFTCASTNRPEHGTLRTSRNDSYGTIAGLADMSNYYKNLTIKDFNESTNVRENYSDYKSYYQDYSKDLYFMGFKKGGPPRSIVPYIRRWIYDTSSDV